MLTNKSRGSEEVLFGETCLLCLSRWEDQGSSRSVAKATFPEKQNLPFPQKISLSQLAAFNCDECVEEDKRHHPWLFEVTHGFAHLCRYSRIKSKVHGKAPELFSLDNLWAALGTSLCQHAFQRVFSGLASFTGAHQIWLVLHDFSSTLHYLGEALSSCCFAYFVIWVFDSQNFPCLGQLLPGCPCMLSERCV